MNKKLIKTGCLIVIISLIITGCSTSLKNENSILSQEITALKEKNSNLENKIADLNNKIKEQEIEFDKIKKTYFNKNDNMYPIYTADIDTYERKIDVYFYITKETVLKQKLQILSKVLSEAYFDNLPIKVLRIEEIDKKKIAIVNLSESAENQGITDYKALKGKTWKIHYMQGSTGGTVTSTRLIETLLQRDYAGQWIDGVKFLYENSVCDYEHAPNLKEINYR
jgi:hypothetical protein